MIPLVILKILYFFEILHQFAAEFFVQLKKNFILPTIRKLRIDDLIFNIRPPQKYLLRVEHKILKSI